VHSLWRPIPGQFDDYIAMPKANLYQSLHTAVIGPDAKPLEVQIRTRQMHEVAEAGIAAHWRYKEGSRGDRRYDEKLAWVRQLIEWQREVVDATEFVEGLKLDIFQDQVFVFTPKGDVKDLPSGATPLDFAYRIHTDVGHRTIGSKVNNRLVPLDYRLRNGDIVEIITTKAAHGPSRDWLSIVRTNQAREKIRAWFKHQQRDENVAQGKELLDRELRRLAHETLSSVNADRLATLAAQAHYKELDDFYAAIGYGAVSPASVVGKLEIHDDAALALPEVAPPAVSVPSSTGIRVKGVGDLLVRFANCCSPIPGDPITGYVTRGKGVTVHRATCPSVLSERDIERLIDVDWQAADLQTYPITVRIAALDRPGLLSEITNVVAEDKVNIVAASIGTHPDGTAAITATLKVTSLQQLSKVLQRIERVRDVTSVTREAR
jgi:GTP pyrophosphokinase